MTTKIVTTAVVCSLLSLLFCTTEMPGGSTESTNQKVAGLVYEPDGVTPAKGAIVVIRSQNTLAAVAGVTTEQPSGTKDTAVTDKYGRYGFDELLNSGLYSFEATKDTNAIFINPVNVANSDSTLEIDPVTLKPTGKITGKIDLAEGGDPTEVYVLAFGIDRFARVNSDGRFTFSGLGEGEYYLKIVTSLDNYGAFDTAWISVVASRATDLGTITLPFSGIPVPQKVTATYDSDLQQATIRWSKVDRPGVKYYNIYRGYKGFVELTINFYNRINESRVTDTVFIDSLIGGLGPTGVPGAVAYSITVVDSAENEGEKSPAIEIVTPPSFTTIKEENPTSFLSEQFGDFATARNGDIFAASDYKPLLFILDSALNYKKTIEPALPFIPTRICINKTSALLYIAPSSVAGVFVYNFEGMPIDTIEDPTITTFGVTDCEVINNSLHVLTGGDSVISFDDRGNRKTTWHVLNGQCIADGGAARVVVGAYKKIYWHDSIGNLLSSMQVLNYLSIAADTTKQHLWVLTGDLVSFSLREYDSTHLKIRQYVSGMGGGCHGKYVMGLQRDGNPLVLNGGCLVRLRGTNQ